MTKEAFIAKINETECIGCTKCLDVCPVDAILGASKQLHVILSNDCIGCELCLPPCPVNCIEMLSIGFLSESERRERAQLGKQRAQARKLRLQKREREKAMADKQQTATDLKAFIAAAIVRAQQKRTELPETTLE